MWKRMSHRRIFSSKQLFLGYWSLIAKNVTQKNICALTIGPSGYSSRCSSNSSWPAYYLLFQLYRCIPLYRLIEALVKLNPSKWRVMQANPYITPVELLLRLVSMISWYKPVITSWWRIYWYSLLLCNVIDIYRLSKSIGV